MSSSKSARYTRIPLRCCGTESGNFSHAVPTRIPTVNSRKWIHERPRVQAPPERDTGKGTTRRRGGAKQATGQREAKEAHEGSPRISSRSRSFSACSPASFPGLASHTTRTAPEGVRVVCGCFTVISKMTWGATTRDALARAPYAMAPAPAGTSARSSTCIEVKIFNRSATSTSPTPQRKS
jgi:hypothetical protein